MIARADISGIVLAGGRGTRMGGVDKGLQAYGTGTLAANALARLRPQVAVVAVSANRHHDRYASLGVPLLADTSGEFDGPLAGILAGLAHCTTPYLAVVPCDAPSFPHDLVARLSRSLAAAAPAAVAALASTTSDRGETRIEAAFCLLHRSLAGTLARDLARGERKASRWLLQQGHVVVEFTDAATFANVNTLAELARLQPS